MKNTTLYIIISVLVLLNIGQFVYFYSRELDLKFELKVYEFKMSNRKNNNSEIENTPLGFELFVKSRGLTVKKPYDGIQGQTNELDPNGAKTNDWWFSTNSKTFESY